MTTITEYGYMAAPYMVAPYMSGFAVAATGMQAQSGYDVKTLGIQVASSGLKSLGMQANYAVYDTSSLRIMCEFPSRGVTGGNWTASSTASGDFSANNLNNDIVEKQWRSANLSTQILNNDAQIPIIIDTFAILSHNFSRGAVVTLQISNDPTFTTIDINETLQWTEDNIFWIAPELPLNLYQYTRIIIDDSTNPDGYVYVGTIVFGSSNILIGGCILDDISFGYKDFAGVVPTYGYTNVSNSQSLKKVLALEFDRLNTFERNFQVLRSLFTQYRTTHKCLWIPTPDLDDQSITAKYAVFAKLSELPVERHKSPDNDIDYASFSVELDESL